MLRLSAWFNVGSLVFGMAAWYFPIIGLVQRRVAGKASVAMPALSLGCCAFTLCFQLMFLNNMVAGYDWSGLEELAPIVSIICVLFLLVTLLLNTALLIMGKNQTENKVN